MLEHYVSINVWSHTVNLVVCFNFLFKTASLVDYLKQSNTAKKWDEFLSCMISLIYEPRDNSDGLSTCEKACIKVRGGNDIRDPIGDPYLKRFTAHRRSFVFFTT